MKYLLIVLQVLALIAGTPSVTSAQSGYFEVDSTWSVSIGSTLAERMAKFNNPTPGSTAFMSDILGTLGNYATSLSEYSSVHCTAKNSDPLKTVTGVQPRAVILGWNVLHIPDSCSPPGGSDGHVVIVNLDDPRFLWSFGRGSKDESNNWAAFSITLWARTAAAAGVNGAVGRGMGVMSTYDNSGGAGTACRASIDTALGTVLKSELDADVINHALRFAYNGYRLLNGMAQPYPCSSNAIGINNRSNAGTMGQRVMLDPAIDVESLHIGNALKTMLRAAQTYGFIQSDVAPDLQFYVEKRDWTGYNFSPIGVEFASYRDFGMWLIRHSHEIACVDAFTGECAGNDPLTILPQSFITVPFPISHIQ